MYTTISIHMQVNTVMENLQMKQNKQINNQPWMLLSSELEAGFIAFLEWNEWKKGIMFDHLFHNSHGYSH